MSSDERPIKVVINGYPGNGRTSLLMTMVDGHFPDEHAWVPMCHDNVTIVKDVPSSRDGPLEPTSIELWDTMAGDYSCIGGLMSLSFPETNIFLLCFAVCDPLSLEMNDFFIDLYREHQVDTFATIVFVGTKTDVVESPEEHGEIFAALKKRNMNPLTKEDLQRHAQEVTRSGVRVSGVCMCSALTGKGVKDVLVESVRLMHGEGEELKKPKKCSIQ